MTCRPSPVAMIVAVIPALFAAIAFLSMADHADAFDSKMRSTYADLASKVALTASDLPSADSQLWVAIVGGPGSGKSTLAHAVADLCESEHGTPACVLPMDGFHFPRARLAELDPPDALRYLPRRGAPHTFDAEGLTQALRDAKRERAAVMPDYSREISDPVLGGAELKPHHRVVLVEGNYLLLGALLEQHLDIDDASLSPLEGEPPLTVECERWTGLLEIWDESWFILPEGGMEEVRRRLIERHLKTWTDAKTKAWGATTAREGATKRAEFNDLRNALLVERCQFYADSLIKSI